MERLVDNVQGTFVPLKFVVYHSSQTFVTQGLSLWVTPRKYLNLYLCTKVWWCVSSCGRTFALIDAWNALFRQKCTDALLDEIGNLVTKRLRPQCNIVWDDEPSPLKIAIEMKEVKLLIVPHRMVCKANLFEGHLVLAMVIRWLASQPSFWTHAGTAKTIFWVPHLPPSMASSLAQKWNSICLGIFPGSPSSAERKQQGNGCRCKIVLTENYWRKPLLSWQKRYF